MKNELNQGKYIRNFANFRNLSKNNKLIDGFKRKKNNKNKIYVDFFSHLLLFISFK